ncbi:hypothetical protein HDK90DRAFT_531085 [Phyllosticta capitalensis]|uniref:DUF7730 domain-containing protein n=1 Tax=Phyllosticta capitalensis TaxID=121624 RepID=A0ABR1YZ11_9PEZI
MEQDLDPTALVESDNLDDPNESDDSDQALFVPAAETPHIEAPDQVGSQSSDDDDDDDWKIVEGIELAHDVPSIKLLSVSQTAHVNLQNNARSYKISIEASSAFPIAIGGIEQMNRARGGRAGTSVVRLVTQHYLSHFWKLSIELRELIYRYAIMSDSPIGIGAYGTRWDSPNAKSERTAQIVRKQGKFSELWTRARGETLTLGLLTANKQLYTEAIGVLYSANIFSVHVRGLKTFLDKAGGKVDRHIRRLRLELLDRGPGSGDYLRAFNEISCLSRLPNLKELQLDFSLMGWKIVQLFAAKDFFRHAHRWIAEVAKKHDDKFAAVKLIKAVSKPPSGVPRYRNKHEPVSKEYRKEATSHFSVDLKKFIENPSLARKDELDRFFESGYIPRSYFGFEWNRWRILDDVRSRQQAEGGANATTDIELETGWPVDDDDDD